MLVVFGGFWLSVRGQRPYTGDISGWAIAVAVVLVGDQHRLDRLDRSGAQAPG